MNARSRGEGLCLLGLVEGLQLPAHDVRIGAVVMDQVPSRVGNVGEEAGDEVEIGARIEIAPREIEVGEKEFDVIIVNDDISRAAGELAKALGR